MLLLTSKIVEDRLLSELNNRQIESVGEFSMQLQEELPLQNARRLYDIVLEEGKEMGARALVTGASGVVLADSFSTLNGIRLEQREVLEVLSGARDMSYGYHRIFGNKDTPEWAVYYASAIVSEGRIIGSCVISKSITDVVSRTREIRRQYLLIFGGVIVVAALLAYLLTNHISRPLELLRENAIKIAGGDFSQRMDIKGRDEIAELSRAFNYMTAKLQNVDKQRNEFVSNASHELKTPMAAMKILTESILYQDGIPEEVYKDFLTDINTEIDRLTKLTDDLLYMTKLENDVQQPDIRSVSLVKIVETTIKQLRPLAEQKDITLSFEYSDSLNVECDAMRIRQAVNNLIDNAIKYTRRGGAVEAYVDFTPAEAVVSITDSGVGIAEENIPHVFDRFYRVDKARARKTGGTGLGLHIVQRIAVKHGGRVEVSSEEGKGSQFKLILPLKQQRQLSDKTNGENADDKA